MQNFNLPNPAQSTDQVAALLAAMLATNFLPPVVTVTPTNGSATTQTYVVVAKLNGQVVPSVATSTTVGPTTLSATNFNTIGISPLVGVQAGVAVAYDVYRTVGGATQGIIASNLSLVPGQAQLSLVDNGLAAVAATTPPFNTSGIIASGTQEAVLLLTGTTDAITNVSGQVYIGSGSADATTLGTPIAGSAAQGGHDGCVLTILCKTAFAHTVTAAANKINGSTHIITFAAAVANNIVLQAYGGVWYVLNSVGVTLS